MSRARHPLSVRELIFGLAAALTVTAVALAGSEPGLRATLHERDDR